MLSQRTECILKMLVATLCWGASFVAARIAAPYAGPATLAFTWYCDAIRVLGIARTAVFINLVPVSSIIFSIALLNEHVAWSTVLGGCITITGTWLTNRV